MGDAFKTELGAVVTPGVKIPPDSDPGGPFLLRFGYNHPGEAARPGHIPNRESVPWSARRSES